MYIKSVVEKVTLFGHIFVIFNGKLRNIYAAFRLFHVRQKYDNIYLAKGHSTTVSISVSKTDDLGSIPSAPAIEKRRPFGCRFSISWSCLVSSLDRDSLLAQRSRCG